MTLRFPRFLVPAAALVLALPLARADVAQLQRSFDRPPDDARPMARWWWFGPAVTKPEIEREMKFMKEGGFGGFEVEPIYPMALDDEKTGLKNLTLLSPEFFDALKFTATNAKSLGLRMNLTLGSGWPYGGPMFPISEAAGRIRILSVLVAPGQRTVPVPTFHPGEPGPRGGGRQSSVEFTAPPLAEGESVIAAYIGGQSGPNPYREVEIRDGVAQLPTPPSEQATAIFAVASHTGMMVKRPAVGGEGYVIDHYSPTVVNKFIREVAEPEVKALGADAPFSVFCDSLEVAGEDWTPDFLAEFQKRRGYDLRPWLPALSNDIGEKSKDLRYDWGRTITELFNDRFISPLEQWAKANKTRFRIQAYGTPPAALFSYAYADLPEGEGFTWHSFSTSRWAASASHLLGRPVTSSETWTWLHSPIFRASPLDMKAEADLHFLEGINQLIAHGWPYTPESIPYPGWHLYASAVFNEKNPWWIVMPDITTYLQRVSYLLRQGQPANDVALYLSDSDAWATFVPGRVAMSAANSQVMGRDIIGRVLDAGYNLDFLDDGLLDLRGRIDGKTLAFGDTHYRAVILPGVDRIPLKTMRTLEQFAKNGGLVVATRRLPARAPGLQAPEAETREIGEIAARLFTAPNAPGLYVENEAQLGTALAARLKPDLALNASAPEIGFVHRHTDDGEIYFLANTANTPKTLQATFRVEGLQPEWWDPMTGRVTAAEVAARPAGGTTVSLSLEPYGSQVLMFTSRKLPAARPAADGNLPPAVDLSGGWNVAFGKDAKPAPMEKLQSWTESDATKYFSGVATYEKSVTVPAAMLEKGVGVQLNFGETKPFTPTGRGMQRMQALVEAPVREAAVVYVNGKRAGSVWHPPYVVDVTGLLKAGDNTVRVEVANLAMNQMAGHPLPDYKALIARYGDRFQVQDLNQVQPITAGLLGPIRLVAVAK
ncbi:MAG TPA: glycosyl hydrolase [Opitutaceae bacterium]|nr:glycosyl hydrolase [Opitutaceae bacterium]